MKKKVKFRRIVRNKFAEKLVDFAGILWEFSRQTSPKSNRYKMADFVVTFKANFA